MCGEHPNTASSRYMSRGSSPHVRGAPVIDAEIVDEFGIIPACAGSTPSPRLNFYPLGDHPRMCGEHGEIFHCQRVDGGSSPHVRGAPVCSTCTPRNTGIIPACAGSTRNPPTRPPLRWDHPRMCGEHETLCSFLQRIRGSSPHVRGAHGLFHSEVPFIGIIPACAGSTLQLLQCSSFRRDHPRMCGEHTVQPAFPSHPRGSSPHVRGAHDRNVSLTRLGGIIPACAGSTRR